MPLSFAASEIPRAALDELSEVRSLRLPQKKNSLQLFCREMYSF
jgi:hypothetical protein